MSNDDFEVKYESVGSGNGSKDQGMRNTLHVDFMKDMKDSGQSQSMANINFNRNMSKVVP